MKRIYSSLDGLLIEYLHGLLEANGVPCLRRNQFLSGAAGELPPNECWPEVWVMVDSDLPRAQEILRQALGDSEKPAKDWVCPGCKERIQAQFATCWNCGHGDNGSQSQREG